MKVGERKLTDRLLAVLLTFVMLLGMIPAGIMTVGAVDDQSGTASALESSKVTISEDGKTASLENAAVTKLDASASPDGTEGWFVGVRMTAPNSMKTAEDFEGVKYREYSTADSEQYDEYSFWDNQSSEKDTDDTERYIDLYARIDEEMLIDAMLADEHLIKKSWTFDWDKNGEFEQSLTLEIDASTISLKSGDVEVYPSNNLGIVSPVTDGIKVDKLVGNIAKLSLEKAIELKWYKADASIGRSSDGWWIGFAVTAPAGFDTAKAQFKDGSNTLSFNEVKDDGSDDTMTIWQYVNVERLSNGIFSRSFRFDWNGDGVFEQVVRFDIDPAKVTLKNADGTQAFPPLGEVSSDYADISGDKTAEVELKYDGTALTWTENNGEKAWYVETSVAKPAYASDAKYRVKNYLASDYDKFEPVSDLTTLSVKITPKTIETAKDNNEDIVASWQFDWNGDSKADQTVTFTIDPAKLNLSKKDRDHADNIVFENNSDTIKQWIGDGTYTNTLIVENGTKVTYSIDPADSDIAVINSESGEVTLKKDGKVTVKATVDGGDFYNPIVRSYTLNIVKVQLEGEFKNANPVMIYGTKGNTFQNTVTIKPENAKNAEDPKYSIVSETDLEGNALPAGSIAIIDEKTGEISGIQRSGRIEVKCEVAGNKYYDGFDNAGYVLQINKADQEALKFENLNDGDKYHTVYDPDGFSGITIGGGSTNGKLTYSVKEDKEGIIDSIDSDSGKIIFKKAGASVDITVTMAGNDCYNPTSNNVTVTVDKADQSNFKFTKDSDTVTFNENDNKYKVSVEGILSGEPAQFSIDTDCNSLATVDADSGEVSILKPGTIKINAHVDGNDCYNEADCTFELTVKKDEQKISFKNGNDISITYGTKEYTNEALFTVVDGEENYGHSSKGITYAISSNDSKLGVSVDKNGKISFTDSDNRVGSFTVKATALEDDYYNSVSTECTYTVKYLDTPENAYTLSGKKSSESNEWYTGDVTVTALDGYKLSKSNALKEENEWTDSLTYSGDGLHDSENVYLKETSTGFITDIIAIDAFKIDTAKPNAKDLKINEKPFIVKALDQVTFHLFKLNSVTFGAEISDETSGISSVKIERADTVNGERKLLGEFNKINEKEKSVNVDIPVDNGNDFAGFIFVTVTDCAGNENTVRYDPYVIVDNLAPDIDTTTTGELNAIVDKDNNPIGASGNPDRYIYRTDVRFAVNITENHLYDDVNSYFVITAAKDGTSYDLNLGEWDKTGNVYSNSVSFTEDGTYVVTITAKDIVGNEASTYTSAKITVDKTSPEIEFNFDENGIANGKYYNTDKKEMGISVSDVNFDPSNSKVFINDTEQTVEWVQSESDKNTWNIKTLLKFDTDGVYKVRVQSIDLAGNKTVAGYADIVIDTTNPEVENVNYGDDIVIIDPNSKQAVVGYTLGSDPGTNIIYTTSNTIKFDVAEINFTSANAKIECDYTDYNGNKSDKKIDVKFDNNGSFKLDSDGYYKNIKLTVYDLAGNETVYQFEDIMINPPAPTFSWDPNNIVNGGFYNVDKTVTFGVNDVLFNENNANIVLTKNGENVDISDIHWDKTWNKLLDEDGVYHLEFSYANAIGVKATNSDDNADKSLKESVNITFTIDKTAPDKDELKINYSTPNNKWEWVDDLLGKITFGAYNYGDKKLTVNLTAYDKTAGIDKFVLKYDRQDNVSDKNAKEFTKEIKYSGNEKTATVEYTFDKEELKNLQFRGFISFVAYDKAGNYTEYADNEHISIVDSISPTCSVSIIPDFSYTGDNTLYFKEKATVSIEVEEANFYEKNINVVVENLGTSEKSNPEIKWNSVGDTHTGIFTIENDGDYVVKIKYTDKSGNIMTDGSGNIMDEYESAPIHVDHIAPEISVKWTPEDNKDASDKYYQAASRTAEITVTEHNFRAEKFIADITSEDVSGVCDVNVVINGDNSKTVNLKDINSMLQDINNWTKNGDNYTIKVTFPEAQYNTFKLSCKDAVDNAAKEYSTEFILDETKPSGLNIQYSTPNMTWKEELLEKITFGAYNHSSEKLTVTLTASDITSGIDRFEWRYVKQDGTSDSNAASTDKNNPNVIKSSDITYSPDGKTAEAIFTLDDAEYRGHIEFIAYDKAGNSEKKSDDGRVNIVDSVAPDAKIEYEDCIRYEEDNTVFFKNEAKINVIVDEANFYSNNVVFELLKDGSKNEMPQVSWTSDGDIHTGSFTIPAGEEYGDGDYSLTVKYTDRSGNEMIDVTSAPIHVDSTNPEISVVWTPNDNTNSSENYIKSGSRTAKITVTEHNFRAEKVAADINAVDVSGVALGEIKVKVNGDKTVNIKYENEKFDINKILSDSTNWVHDNDKHTIELTFLTEAQYDKFILNCADAVNYTAGYETKFILDGTNPDNLGISYSTQRGSSWQDVINSITFGMFAYNRSSEKLTVTLKASDITSGIDRFEWRYVKQDGASDSNLAEKSGTIVVEQKHLSNDNKTATVEFTLDDAEYRGHIEFTVFDKAGNSIATSDNNRINIVDSTKPTYTAEVSKPVRAVGKDSKDLDLETLNRSVNNIFIDEDYDETFYYDKDTLKSVTFSIKEANFYPEYVKVSYTLNGGEDIPLNVEWSKDSEKADTHTATVSLDGYSDGDYVVKMTYTDRSGNVMFDYRSPKLVIDTTKPLINVFYSSSDNSEEDDKFITENGNDVYYYKYPRHAQVKITEHNFRPSDVNVTVTAVNAAGEKVKIRNSAGELIDLDATYHARAIGNWVNDKTAKDGDTYVMDFEFIDDANYTFDISYSDLASNVPEKEYETDYFTVDKTRPTNFKVKYEEKVSSAILNAITFGYYGTNVKVTISAEDETSGVNRFDYEGVLADGVSGINEKILRESIFAAEIKRDGTVFSTSFIVPKETLTALNSFNGTLKFNAYDKANNSIEVEDDERLVIDKIAPVCDVTFDPETSNNNNISYYDGNFTATIRINEANFYQEDVDVRVNNTRITPTDWTKSGDVWTSHVSFTDEGSYVLTVNYTDRSGNKMTEFKSNEKIIDKTAPVITVSNIKHESANNGDKIGFTISVTDKNIASASCRPSLNVVVRKADDQGNMRFETVSIALNSPSVSVNAAGETVYTYTVENLDSDGYYSLTCSVEDYANHKVSTIGTPVDNGGTSNVETVNFSVNRLGSVFTVETEHNDKYSGDVMTNKLNGAYANDRVKVVVKEINVDRVGVDSDEANKTVVTVNDGSSSKNIGLVEDNNYVKNISEVSGAGGWFETVYTLDNDCFDHDGTYSVDILSYDRANNRNLNTADENAGGTIDFVLDRTLPVITTNIPMKNDTDASSVNASEFNLDINVADNNLDTITVNIDGKQAELEQIGDNSYRTVLAQRSRPYSIDINSSDKAGNKSETYSVDRFTVSTSLFVRWYANTVLFWGVIAAVALLFILLIIFLIVKRRKNNDKDEKAAPVTVKTGKK